MKRLDYSSATMEKFAIRVIANSFDESYSNYIWHDKDDDFDFTSVDDAIALEVITILPCNVINAIQYERALDKDKIPNVKEVVDAQIDQEGELLIYYGGSMDEIRNTIVEAISKKGIKRAKRKKLYYRYELCLCVEEGGLFNTPSNFRFIIDKYVLSSTKFSRLFIITCSNFYVIENNEIKEYRRIIK